MSLEARLGGIVGWDPIIEERSLQNIIFELAISERSQLVKDRKSILGKSFNNVKSLTNS